MGSMVIKEEKETFRYKIHVDQTTLVCISQDSFEDFNARIRAGEILTSTNGPVLINPIKVSYIEQFPKNVKF